MIAQIAVASGQQTSMANESSIVLHSIFQLRNDQHALDDGCGSWQASTTSSQSDKRSSLAVTS